jgi:hypothetical protein
MHLVNGPNRARAKSRLGSLGGRPPRVVAVAAMAAGIFFHEAEVSAANFDRTGRGVLARPVRLTAEEVKWQKREEAKRFMRLHRYEIGPRELGPEKILEILNEDPGLRGRVLRDPRAEFLKVEADPNIDFSDLINQAEQTDATEVAIVY